MLRPLMTNVTRVQRRVTAPAPPFSLFSHLVYYSTYYGIDVQPSIKRETQTVKRNRCISLVQKPIEPCIG